MLSFLSNRELFKIIAPPILATLLFVTTVFGYLLPSFKSTLIEQQKYMLEQMVNTAWNMINVIEKEVDAGNLTEEDAKRVAKHHLRGMRYGEDGLDYFWINDLQAVMVMHPYQPELEGKDISKLVDFSGKAFVEEFVEVAKNLGEGYVHYEWQWKNDSSRIEPKLSFVKLYPRWNWIIGTGVYLNDINSKIARLSLKMVISSVLIIFITSLLTFSMTMRSLKLSRKRHEAEAKLKKHQDHLEKLVDERTEKLSLEIKEREKIEEKLKQISITDELTGLYNRRGFIELAEKQLQVANRHSNTLFLLFIDLDDMKGVNDLLGHEAGDNMLIETADLLTRIFRESDIISRLGGDEFSALVIGSEKEEKKQTAMERLQSGVDLLNTQVGRSYQLSMSIGATRFDPEIHHTLDDLLSDADARMYEEKKKRKGH